MAKRKQKDPPKACARCQPGFAIPGEKYCSACRKEVLAELKAAGYISDAHPPQPITYSEERGRKAVNLHTLGGAAEMGTDGDDW
jgi:hypothetical protein